MTTDIPSDCRLVHGAVKTLSVGWDVGVGGTGGSGEDEPGELEDTVTRPQDRDLNPESQGTADEVKP